jgi:hypothetical protein
MYPEDAANAISEYDYGLHCLIIYSDLPMLRKFYSRYIPQQIKYKKEIIQFHPFYETEESVRQVLYNGDKRMNMDKIGIKDGDMSLTIIDSLSKYNGQENDAESIWSANQEMVKYANGLGKEGVSIIGDMGSFLFKNRIEELLNYELCLPRRFEIDLKGICLYHHKDFDRLSDYQRKTVTNQHEKVIRI